MTPDAYERLRRLSVDKGFRSVTELVTALALVFLDRMEEQGRRLHDLPEDDGAYIDAMFDEASEAEREMTRYPNGYYRPHTLKRRD